MANITNLLDFLRIIGASNTLPFAQGGMQEAMQMQGAGQLQPQGQPQQQEQMQTPGQLPQVPQQSQIPTTVKTTTTYAQPQVPQNQAQQGQLPVPTSDLGGVMGGNLSENSTDRGFFDKLISGLTGAGLTKQEQADWQKAAAIGSFLSNLGKVIGGDTFGGKMASSVNDHIQGSLMAANAKETETKQNAFNEALIKSLGISPQTTQPYQGVSDKTTGTPKELGQSSYANIPTTTGSTVSPQNAKDWLKWAGVYNG